MNLNIAVICGTHRPNSRSMVVARFLEKSYLSLGHRVGLIDLEKLPLECFAPQAFSVKPPGFAPFQKSILEANGLHLVVPEYNGSYPGVLKHFIDLLEYPASFQHRPVALVGLGHRWGGLRPVEHLGQVFGYRNSYQLPERVFIQDAKNSVDTVKGVYLEETAQRLGAQAQAFVSFIEQLKGRL